MQGCKAQRQQGHYFKSENTTLLVISKSGDVGLLVKPRCISSSNTLFLLITGVFFSQESSQYIRAWTVSNSQWKQIQKPNIFLSGTETQRRLGDVCDCRYSVWLSIMKMHFLTLILLKYNSINISHACIYIHIKKCSVSRSVYSATVLGITWTHNPFLHKKICKIIKL